MKNTTTKNNPILPLNLTRFGFDVSNPEDEEIDVESLTEIRQFIRANLEKSKTINSHIRSYGLKGYVERKLDIYIKNGDFIAAMILEEFSYKQSGLNAYFNISEKSVKKVIF